MGIKSKAFCLALLIGGCSTFEQAALDAKWNMHFEAHSKKVGEWEPLSPEKNWLGDCSNLCAYLKQEYPLSKVYWGQIKDGRYHCMTCLDDKCADTLHSGMFKPYDGMWRYSPIVIDI